MSLLDLIFPTSQKIYASQIEKIPGSRFSITARFEQDGKKTDLSGVGLKNAIIGIARNGISLTRLEEELKKRGLSGNQLRERKFILDLIKEETAAVKKPQEEK